MVNVDAIDGRICSVIADTIGSKITEVWIENCQNITWNGEVKKLLANTKSLEVLILKNNSWLDDFMMEQLAIRYQKTLVHLELENLSISNSALFQMGRRCSGLQTLSLVCLPKVTDAGLIEMAKTIHVSVLTISHNLKITDKGIEALVYGAKNLQSVVLVNCPKLTNQAVASMYEITASWGKKRNMESEPITHLEIRDNSNMNAEMLLWVSACLPHLTHLDLRDCSNLHLVKSMNEMISIRKITDLRLGPSHHKVDSAKFLMCMQYQGPQLLVLHLVGIRGLLDQHIGDLIECALNLEEVVLIDVEFATATIESICSNIPNISKLQLTGSSIFADIDLRCLTTICRNLLELTIQHCPRLTDSGFTRFVSMKLLHKLDMANLSSLPESLSSSSSSGLQRGSCTGAIMQFLTLAPLDHLVLDGLPLPGVVDSFSFLMKCTFTKLKTLSLKRCPQVRISDVSHLLARFVGCEVIDCTGCPDLPPPSSPAFTELPHLAPFLRYEYTSEFSGFRLSAAGRSRFVQYWAVSHQLRRHYGARLMQRLRRKYLRRLVQLKQKRRERWSDFKHWQLSRIQGLVRGFLVRRRLARIKAQGSAIVKAARDVIIYRNYLEAKKMKKYYRAHLRIRMFHCWSKNAQLSVLHLSRVAGEVVSRKRIRDLKILFRTLRELDAEFKERKFEDCAGAFREVHFLMRIIKHWRTVVFETATKNQKLVRKFMLSAPLETHNSSHQVANRLKAESFCRQRLLMIAWLCLARGYLVVKRINSLVPIAVNHCAQKFFRRVVGATFQALKQHRVSRLIKKAARQRGTAHHIFYKSLIACRSLCQRMDYQLAAKASMRLAEHQRRSYLTRLAFSNRFPTLTRQTIYYKARVEMVKLYIKQRSTVVNYFGFKLKVIELKKWRIKCMKAELMRHRFYYRRIFGAWNLFRVNSKNMGALYYKMYLVRLSKKVMFALQMNRAMGKEYVRTMQLEIERKTKDAAAFGRFVIRVIQLQAKVRAVRARAKFADERVQKLFAIQTLQNFFRTCLARKEYAGRLRKNEIADRVREDRELELMREAEVETRYYNYRLKAVIDFQRIFRGWKDRLRAMELAIIFYRGMSKEYYSKNKHTRLRHEAFKRVAIARENMRNKMAAQIQKRVRGMQVRKRYAVMKHQATIARHAVYVQREYRRRLAMLKLQAMKRNKKSEIRFNAARRQRGQVLRLLGLRNRKQQSQFGAVLSEMGMEPLSFNYRIGELVAETIADFKNLVGIFKRERALVEENGLSRLAISMGRRKVLLSQGWKMKVQDAVRIIEKGHKYEGYTGVICRIDENILGIPLYEIKLDKFGRQTFLRMTTDAYSSYMYSQPLTKVQVKPRLLEYEQPSVIFGIDPDDPFYCKKNVNAAWTVQRAFRVFRSRKIASRKRYELWLRSAGRQWSLLSHMAETNTLTFQGYNVAGLIGVRPVKPVFYDEIRHPFTPARLTSRASRDGEVVAIKKEYDLRYRDRIAYLQKCALMQGREYFATGYERMNFGRKLGLLASMSYGLVFKKKAPNISDMQGTRGVKFLSRQQSMVTGLDQYCFKQFQGSPHVRYYKVRILYIYVFSIYLLFFEWYVVDLLVSRRVGRNSVVYTPGSARQRPGRVPGWLGLL